MDIIFRIPDQHITRVVDGLQKQFFSLAPPGIDASGLTSAKRAKEAIRLWIIQSVKSSEYQDAMDTITIDVPDDVVESDI